MKVTSKVMDGLLGQLELFLDSSKLPDQQKIDQATAFIMEVRAKPDGLLLLLTVLLRTQNPSARHAAAVNALSLVRQAWPSLAAEVQDEGRNLLLQCLQLDGLRREEISVLADSCALIFESMIARGVFWNELVKLICVSFQQQKFAFTVLVLSRVFPAMPESLVAESYAGFRNMAYVGLNDESLDVCIDAVSVFFRIAKVTKDVDILKPVVTFLYPECERCLEMNRKDFEMIWATVAQLLRFDGVPMENVMSFFTVAMAFITGKECSIDQKLMMLDAFLPVVPIVEPSVIEVFLSCSIAMAVDVVNQQDMLPEEYMAMPEKMLTTRPQKEISPVVQAKVQQLLESGGNPGQVTVGILLLAQLLRNGQGCLRGSLDFVKTALMTGLKSDNAHVLLASLMAVKAVSEAEIAELTVDLLKEVMNLVVSANDEVRNSAYDALMTLCETCDTEVDGLFDAIWSFQTKDMVRPADLENYILLVAHVVRLSNDINDDKLAKLVGFIRTVFTSGDELSTKTTGLQLVSTLLAKRETLVPELVPAVTPVLNEALQFSDQGVVCQALAFIQNLVFSFGSSVADVVKPYIAGVAHFITDTVAGTGVFISAIKAASAIVKSLGDAGLLQTTIAACTSLIQTSEIESRITGCESVALISKVLAAGQHLNLAMELFGAICSIVETEDDVDAINAAFEALTKLLKKCRPLSASGFDERSIALLRSILQGEIKYLKGSVQLLFDSPPEFVEYLMEFMAVYARHGQAVNDICKFVVEWLPNASEAVLASLTGVLTDAIEYNTSNVNPAIVGAVVTFVGSIAEKISDPGAKQNIVVLLYVMLRTGAIDIATANKLVPLLNQWWNQGVSEPVGQKSLLSNIAVFYLDIHIRGGEVDGAVLQQAILAFPPADLKESQRMSELMITLMSRDQAPDVRRAFAISVGDFLTEPKAVSDKRKVKEETRNQLVGIFKTAVGGDETLRGAVMEKIGDNQQRVQTLTSLFV